MTVKDLLDLFKKWEDDNIADKIYLPSIHLFSDGSGKITNDDDAEIYFHNIDELTAILKRGAK